MTRPLFIYGTLHPDRAPAEVRNDIRHLRAIGRGKVRGRLLDLGEFPGAILSKNGNEISGTVFELPEDPALLSRLDAYEEYDPSHPEKSLFLRERTIVKMEDGSQRECWIYIYNQKPARAVRAS